MILTPTRNHHTNVRFCRMCGRWHCRCDGCGWIWYSACSFTEALRQTRIHQWDKTYLESQREAVSPRSGSPVVP
jgi:hypothetical protein